MSEPIAEGWVDATSASEIVGYTSVYVRLLARAGRIEARKVGRDWLVSLSSLLAYKAEMERLGTGKHNPWRGDLGDQERGRPRE
jgi:hypothetical protein